MQNFFFISFNFGHENSLGGGDKTGECSHVRFASLKFAGTFTFIKMFAQ